MQNEIFCFFVRLINKCLRVKKVFHLGNKGRVANPFIPHRKKIGKKGDRGILLRHHELKMSHLLTPP